MFKHAAKVVPRRRVVRRERDLLLRERELPPQHPFAVLVPGPNPTGEDDEEAVVPRRVVPDVVLEEPLDVGALTAPEVDLVVEVREDPLAEGPGVIVLGIVR